MKKKFNVYKIKSLFLSRIIVIILFSLLALRMGQLALSETIDGINLKEFQSNRNTVKKTVYARRGKIYDAYGNTLVQTINSYTVIAYLEEDRGEGNYVENKELTAKALAPVLNMSEEAILYLLNKDAYQVELGPGGRDITELKKDEVKNLKLDGIDFISSYKRYYQNDDFASYILGYVKQDSEGVLNGEMGIELYYNNLLNGEDGFTIYQQDAYGYKIPNTKEETKEATDGVDIYLTIDSNIQFFADKYSKEAYETYDPDWLITVVADAKTGAILASSSYPSFNPNELNLTNYLNPLVSYSFEPGSTFKTFTYMLAMEKGIYDGSKTFRSGSIDVGSNTIYDWYTQGFGDLTYDDGYIYSSNVGIVNLIKSGIEREELREYFEKLGFGSKTGIELPLEVSGSLDFYYDVELYNAGFGQGITVTPIQMVQALTSIANDGVMLKPYIVDKIIDTNTNEVTYKGTKTEVATVASHETIEKIKDLMYKVIYNDYVYSTGVAFKLEGYDIIGKTGTAQYTNPETGTYYFDSLHYIRSFAGMFPKDDPEIIIYVALKKPYNSAAGLNSIVRGLIKDISNYKGIYTTTSTDSVCYKIDNYLNSDTNTIYNDLSNKFSDVVVIGNGDKIINQYPVKDTSLSVSEKVFLLTNGDITYKDFTGWSLKEVQTYMTLANIKYTYTGSGYVVSQSIEKDTLVTDEIINLVFEDKIKIEVESDE